VAKQLVEKIAVKGAGALQMKDRIVKSTVE
jgi:hypothetical protein